MSAIVVTDTRSTGLVMCKSCNKQRVTVTGWYIFVTISFMSGKN